jgi:hypothetical protein
MEGGRKTARARAFSESFNIRMELHSEPSSVSRKGEPMKSELMKKSSLSWTLLLVVAVATLSMPLYGLEVAEVTPVPQTEPPVINPTEPEKDAGLEAELPDLFIQEPSFVSGAFCPCVNNWQCEEIWGPGSLCYVPPGGGCGYCN